MDSQIVFIVLVIVLVVWILYLIHGKNLSETSTSSPKIPLGGMCTGGTSAYTGNDTCTSVNGSSACGYNASTTQTICCTSGKSTPIANGASFNYYCTGVADGGQCLSNEMCQSGSCNTSVNPGVCVKTESVGGPCRYNTDCMNGKCGYMSVFDRATGKSRVCCQYDTTQNLILNDSFCTNVLNRDDVCYNDDECKSRTCSGNLGGLQAGKCE